MGSNCFVFLFMSLRYLRLFAFGVNFGRFRFDFDFFWSSSTFFLCWALIFIFVFIMSQFWGLSFFFFDINSNFLLCFFSLFLYRFSEIAFSFFFSPDDFELLLFIVLGLVFRSILVAIFCFRSYNFDWLFAGWAYRFLYNVIFWFEWFIFVGFFVLGCTSNPRKFLFIDGLFLLQVVDLFLLGIDFLVSFLNFWFFLWGWFGRMRFDKVWGREQLCGFSLSFFEDEVIQIVNK